MTILSFPLTRYTEKTIVEMDKLEKSLEDIRKRGYAVAHEEFEEGYSTIAAPVHNHLGTVVATIAISGPTFRLESGQIDTFAEELIRITRLVSSGLGYKGMAPGQSQ